MTERDPPDGLREALAQWAQRRSQHTHALAGRDAKPRAGDLYALPCHASVSPTWLVVEDRPDGTVRIAPGDDRPWANTGDLWVGDHELCLRLANCTTLPGALLPADQRIGILADAPSEVLAHEQASRFVSAPVREEDEDQHEWRALIARAARILPRFLADGVVELRLSEFRRADGADADAVGSPSTDSENEHVAQPRMAADSSSAYSAFLRAAEQSEEVLLVDELDCDCGGTLQLVASRRGLGLLFTPGNSSASPPAVMAMDGDATAGDWLHGSDAHQGASRIFFVHDWRAGALSLRFELATAMSVLVVDDVWFT